MSQSRYIIKPLSKHQQALPVVIEELKEELENQQGMELQDKGNLTFYLMNSSYVMLDSGNNDDVIGFFSLTRINGNETNNILQQVLSLLKSCVFGRMLIFDFCILQKYRKRGLGLIMMNMVEDYCLNKYPLVRYLELHTITPTLEHFYNKCGFILTVSYNGINIFNKSI
jgi:GNAT superfamily N-acetyltransferase